MSDTTKRVVRRRESEEMKALISRIQKRAGDTSITKANTLPSCNHISTGAFMLDLALMGGWPEGFVSTAVGLESSGKTTIWKKAVAEYQRKHPNKFPLWIDSESLFDEKYAAKLGVDLDRLYVAKPTSAEETVDIIDDALKTPDVGVVILDSIPGMVPMKVEEKSAEDDTVAMLARVCAKLCSKVLVAMNKSKREGHRPCLWLVNQFRIKIGAMHMTYTMPGGRQINHLPSTILELRNKEVVGKGDASGQVVESDIAFKLRKAKHGCAFREGALTLVSSPHHESGLTLGASDHHKALVAYAKKQGIVFGGGSSWKTPFTDPDPFPKLDAIIQAARENKTFETQLAQSVIMLHRMEHGLDMVPPDNHLFGADVSKTVKDVVTALRDSANEDA